MFRIESGEFNLKVALNIKGIKQMTERGVQKAFYKIGSDLRRDARKEIRKKNKSGRLYRRTLNGRIVLHRASAPGQYPANFTGSLASSIGYNTVGSNRLEFGSKTVFTKGGKTKQLNYGKFLELGTSKMQPRPFLLPTIKSNFSKIETHFNYEIQREIKGRI